MIELRVLCWSFVSGAGCAFIKYSQRDQAQAAINALNGVCVMDVRFAHYEGVVKFTQVLVSLFSAK